MMPFGSDAMQNYFFIWDCFLCVIKMDISIASSDHESCTIDCLNKLHLNNQISDTNQRQYYFSLSFDPQLLKNPPTLQKEIYTENNTGHSDLE